ncbi:MAG TPA: type II toxin-antitoxin system Phd/YefM family antitoxin [Gaiellaceae bacterium]|nr:type II toxin-antitoxin system Phd/YefM family antitoxin [Gaiellaceae bacterium]
MSTRTISASRFKAHCLGLLDEVAETGAEIMITKRGKPVARVVPVEPVTSLAGSVTFLVSDEELMEPVLEPWDAEAE